MRFFLAFATMLFRATLAMKVLLTVGAALVLAGILVLMYEGHAAGQTPVDAGEFSHCVIAAGPNESVHPDNVLVAKSDLGETRWPGIEAAPIDTAVFFEFEAAGLVVVSIEPGADGLSSIDLTLNCVSVPLPTTTTTTTPVAPETTIVVQDTTTTTIAATTTTMAPTTTSIPTVPVLAVTGPSAAEIAVIIALALILAGALMAWMESRG